MQPQGNKAWRSAHTLLGDDAERFAAPWEWLQLWEEVREEVSPPTLRALVDRGCSAVEIAQELGMTYRAARKARWRLLRRK